MVSKNVAFRSMPDQASTNQVGLFLLRIKFQQTRSIKQDLMTLFWSRSYILIKEFDSHGIKLGKQPYLNQEKLYRRRKSEGGGSGRRGGGVVTKYSLIHGVFRSLCQGLLRTAILNNAKALGTRLRNYSLLPC